MFVQNSFSVACFLALLLSYSPVPIAEALVKLARSLTRSSRNAEYLHKRARKQEGKGARVQECKRAR